MKHLFDSYKLKNLELKNRIVMSPMCQYSVENKDGIATDWHYVHYISRAVGGAGLIMIEMTSVEPDGRISDFDLGLWSDDQIPALKRIIDSIHQQGCKVGIQIGHAGRKAEDAKIPVAPSAIPFDENYKTPRALTTDEVVDIVEKFRKAIQRALKTGVDVIELHGAHGYLIHQFISPLTNKRDDRYGKDLNLFAKEIIKVAKDEIPKDMPLLMRISAQEYVKGGYGIDESIKFVDEFYKAGVDMFDISSGGEGQIGAKVRPGTHGGYQVPLARKIKEALNIPVITVGRIDTPELANSIIGNEEADLVAIGRGMLRNPYWSLEASKKINKETDIPKQYEYGFRR